MYLSVRENCKNIDQTIIDNHIFFNSILYTYLYPENHHRCILKSFKTYFYKCFSTYIYT